MKYSNDYYGSKSNLVIIIWKITEDSSIIKTTPESKIGLECFKQKEKACYIKQENQEDESKQIFFWTRNI